MPLRERHRVVLSPEAKEDLRGLYVYIADHSGGARAMTYRHRIEAYSRGFANFPARGTRRDDLFPGLRVIGFERWVTPAFHIDADTVIFDRILYAGQDLSDAFGEDTP